MSTEKCILIIEPFYGGSHAQLINLILSDSEIGPKCDVVTLPAKKWHWRARTSALYFSQIIPTSDYKVIFTSSVLNLAELIALRPDLARVRKIVYFHENQLVYPVRKVQDRDFQFGYNQILTSLVADVVVFNSAFNMESFLSSISSHLRLIPDHRPKNLETIIRPKCLVLYFPVSIHSVTSDRDSSSDYRVTSDFHGIDEDDERTSVQNTVSCLGIDLVHEHGVEAVTNPGSESCISSSIELDCCDIKSKDLTCKSKYSRETEKERIKVRECAVQRPVTSAQNILHPVSDGGILDTLKGNKSCLHIVWPHRWEHDKDPDSFFTVLLQLQNEGLDFHVSVIGETYTEVPDVFHTVKAQLESRIVAWGYQTRQDYLKVLDCADVVVSTALHEFFGVSMLEATAHGCYPLCPKRLVYPEIYPGKGSPPRLMNYGYPRPYTISMWLKQMFLKTVQWIGDQQGCPQKECLYSTQAQLVKRLRRFCQRPDTVKTDKFKNLVEKFSWQNLQERYRKLLLQ